MKKEILQKLKFEEMSLIQENVYQVFNKQSNLVIVSPTGTGKTHSYLIPIYERFEQKPKSGLKLVILVPTNELVFQVQNMTKELFDGYKVRIFHGGMERNRELSWLARNQIDIAIGTPSKIKEFIDLGGLSFAELEYLVFDEADMMFEIDFVKHISPILNTSKLGKLILVSATITQTMNPFIKEYFGNYMLVDVTQQETLDIKHYLIKAKTRDRKLVLDDLLNVINPFFAIIFVSKKEDQDEVYQLLVEKDLQVANLSGDLSVRLRKQTIKEAQELKYQYLVTSDIGSRGLDFQASHIINYDLPYHLEYFIHRSGRTARMQTSGSVYTIEGENDHRKIESLVKKGIKFTTIKLVKGEIVEVHPAKQLIKEEEIQIIRKIKKPSKVKPNYKKKNKAKIEKELKEHRRKSYAKNRKSR